MTKAELIERIARSRELPADLSKRDVAAVLELAFAELGEYFARSKVTRGHATRFSWPGFGTFTKKRRAARRGVNPRTLEPMEIDAAYTIDFRPANLLKQEMNGAPTARRRAPRPIRAALPGSPLARAEASSLIARLRRVR